MINDGVVKRVEVAILPELDDADGDAVVLNALSMTFDRTTSAFDDDF
jgi:hypothetical protein